ncbi:hypothetical protein PBI_PEREGRIN_206 [Rhodococcus phage Peregrin]|nr:hypothetical protein PBI_PEREGRIN_206 [Rhodococcus phage Peregrin]AWN04537.1 hypothetical protein PBI_GRAYSON_209 [Rhodococcus phage Grayson]
MMNYGSGIVNRHRNDSFDLTTMKGIRAAADRVEKVPSHILLQRYNSYRRYMIFKRLWKKLFK